MSLFNKWWDAANSKDRNKMAELLDDDFILLGIIMVKNGISLSFSMSC